MGYRISIDMGDGHVVSMTPKAMNMDDEEALRLFSSDELTDQMLARGTVIDAINRLSNAEPKGSC